MNEINNQVARARRRLMAGDFLRSLTTCWMVAFLTALVGLLVPKFWPVGIESQVWLIGWTAGAAVLGLLTTAVLTWLRRPSMIQAAAEVDRRMKLNERLSSSLQLRSDEQNSPAGQALLDDARRSADRIDIRDAFPIRILPVQLAQMLPLLLAAATTLLPNAVPATTPTAGFDAEALTQVTNSARDLKEQVRKQREKAEEENLQDSADFFKQLENKLDDFQKTGSKDAKKILSDINQLKEAMEKRRQELGSSENLRKNLAGMKSIEKGPAEKLAKSMEEGDFDKAAQEIDRMMSELQSGNMTPEMQEKLADQLKQMAEALEKAAAEHQAEARQLEKQIAEAEAAGDAARVAELRQKLAENQAEAKTMEQMQQMADQMKQAQEAMKNGDKQAAQKALQKMKEQVDKMNQADKQLQELDKLMAGADQCKNCAQGQCEGDGKGGKSDQEDWRWKTGMGEGRGAGPRPESKTDTRSIDSQVRTEMKEGETVYGGKTGGANKKGVSREEVKQAILSAEIEDPEALDSLPLPKKQRDQAREYYDSLRVGKQ